MKYLIINVHILTPIMAMAMEMAMVTSHQSQHQDGTKTEKPHHDHVGTSSSTNHNNAADQEMLLRNTYRQIGHENNGKYFQASTLLVIKNFEEVFNLRAIREQQAYPTEVDQFKWHLHAQFTKPMGVSFFLNAEPTRYLRGDYEIDYEYCITILNRHGKHVVNYGNYSVSSSRAKQLSLQDLPITTDLLNQENGFVHPNDGSIRVVVDFRITKKEGDFPVPTLISQNAQFYFQSSTLLVIKNLANFQSVAGNELEQQQQVLEYPTELNKFKWHLHAAYSEGNVSFALIEEKPPSFEGEHMIDYEYRITILSQHTNMHWFKQGSHIASSTDDSQLIQHISIDELLDEKRGLLQKDGSIVVLVNFKIIPPLPEDIQFGPLNDGTHSYEVSTSLILGEVPEIFPTVLDGFKWHLKAILDKGTVSFTMIPDPLKKSKDDYVIHFE